MASYVYTASSSANASANIQTDKVRIATTSSPVQVIASYPNVAGTGTVTCATNSNAVVGSSTTFTTQLTQGTGLAMLQVQLLVLYKALQMMVT